MWEILRNFFNNFSLEKILKSIFLIIITDLLNIKQNSEHPIF